MGGHQGAETFGVPASHLTDTQQHPPTTGLGWPLETLHGLLRLNNSRLGGGSGSSVETQKAHLIQLLQSLKPLLCSMLCSSRCQQSLLLLHVMLTLPLTGSESLLEYLVRNMMSDYGCSHALLCKDAFRAYDNCRRILCNLRQKDCLPAPPSRQAWASAPSEPQCP